MMIYSGADDDQSRVVDTSHQPMETNRHEDNPWNLPVSKQTMIGGGLVLCALLWAIGNRGGEGKPQIIDNAFKPVLSSQAVETAKDPEEANFLLASARLQSGLVRGQANQFLGMAATFQNQKGHYCFGKTTTACLRSFQETREKQIMSLKMGEISSGTKEQYSETAKLVFEINAIEVAIAGLGGQTDPTTQQFIDTIMPYPDIKEPPTIDFLQAFGDHRKKQQLIEAQNQETLQNQLADQQLDKCRTEGTEGCF